MLRAVRLCAAVIMPRNMCIDTRIFEEPMPYRLVWDMQRSLNEKVAALSAPETILALQHKPVYTLGFHGDEHNMKSSEAQLAASGVELIRVERGGDITFHGPGQLVIYPIVNLRARCIGVRKFVELLQRAVMQFCGEWGVATHLRTGAPGVWCGTDGNEKKICAVGLKVRKGVAMHGLALNLWTDLAFFGAINPCGFSSSAVTSLKEQTALLPEWHDAAQSLTRLVVSAIEEETLQK